MAALLKAELDPSQQDTAKQHPRGTKVVLCGPSTMADDVRCIVAGLARNGSVVSLIVEDFRWSPARIQKLCHSVRFEILIMEIFANDLHKTRSLDTFSHTVDR